MTGDSITDCIIVALRDAACECRPRPQIGSDDHAAIHDCDVDIYDQCVTALEALGEEAFEARCGCACFVIEVMRDHGDGSRYRQELVTAGVLADGTVRMLTDEQIECAVTVDADEVSGS